MRVHTLDELDSTGVALDLTTVERRALLAAGKRLSVEWLPGGSARVRPAGFVGSVALSSEQAVMVTTKVPVANLLGLASLAFRTTPVPPSFGIGLYETAEPTDWFAAMLIAEVETLLGGGIRSGYVTIEDALPYIRGRLRFEAAAKSWSQPGLSICEFSDYVLDTPENRVLRTSLETLACRRLLPGLQSRLYGLLRAFAGVSLVPPTIALLRSTRITRLNYHYAPALELCRLALANAGLEYPGGTTPAPAFFFPMAQVFQDGVANYLRKRLSGVRLQAGRSISAEWGTPDHTLSYVPDITVGDPPSMVLDTKYARAEVRNQYGGLSFRNSNAYQIVFYAHALGCPGVLVYPRDDRDVNADYQVEGTGFTFLTVDLETGGLLGLEALAVELERRLAGEPHGDRSELMAALGDAVVPPELTQPAASMKH